MKKKTILITGFAGDNLSMAIANKLADSGLELVVSDIKQDPERGITLNDHEPIFPITNHLLPPYEVHLTRKERRQLERNNKKNKT